MHRFARLVAMGILALVVMGGSGCERATLAAAPATKPAAAGGAPATAPAGTAGALVVQRRTPRPGMESDPEFDRHMEMGARMRAIRAKVDEHYTAAKRYPADLGALLLWSRERGEPLVPGDFVQPFAERAIPADFHALAPAEQARWINVNTALAYVVAGETRALTSEDVVLYEVPKFLAERVAFEKMKILFCYGDGHCESFPPMKAERIMKPLREKAAKSR